MNEATIRQWFGLWKKFSIFAKWDRKGVMTYPKG